ncbi:DUF4232 domain-containing protein [Streptomyces sp. NPDC060085]|uniref:DUF4232 domain-containing protein n=1 Tax=Streptomyces sp. NPDC060085 TaxID=3347054 RepID=UPI003651A2CC
MKAAVRTTQRNRRHRLLGATAIVALLASTACEAGAGDGPDDSTTTARPDATRSAPSRGTSSAEPTGTGSPTPSGSSSDTAANGGDGAEADGTAVCAAADLSFASTRQDEPGDQVRHLLLTVTNAGNKTCTVYGYPRVRLGADAQAPVALIKDSDPKTPATLAPGDEANAALLVSGGQRDTYEAHTIGVVLQGRKPGSTAGGPVDVPMPGVDTLTVDDGGRVTYWMTPSGLALDFIMSL